MTFLRTPKSAALIAAGFITSTRAGLCTSETVGSPFSTCSDIANAAHITVAQLQSFNSGLNCNTLQIGQKLCVTAGTITAPNSDGSCSTYTVATGDSCFAIGQKFGVTSDQIESWNQNTWKWKGCSGLQVGAAICISSGTPPPIPIDPNQQCGPQTQGNVTCPLKACCSAFGFCGTTEEFCNAAPNGDPCLSNCFMPKLPSCPSGTLTRKVGYYAGWAATRGCEAVGPKDINIDGFTHLLFAFAVIGQDMKISITSTDAASLKDLVARKGSAKVMIAVGGWAFSEEGSQKTLFSTMISTSANRATFISSAKDFISQNGLDGIDIDMEYPSAIERGAPPTDTPDLTAFFQELRAALPSAEISLATPSGYWFLKGFELDKIAPSVSFINLMSYDYHGPWDTNVPGQNSTANPQTSILDIQDSVLLYTRIGIDMSKVNLGLAWYGRSFALASSSCEHYGCNMTGGGKPGSCTNASGVLSYSEISRMAGFGNANYDKTTQTKWFINGTDLITFDDKDTWDAKTQFAATTCFGGTMVWSMDQVDPTPSSGGGGNSGKPCSDAQGWADSHVQRLMKDFTDWTGDTPTPGGSFPGGCGCWQDSDALWHNVVATEAVVRWMINTGKDDYKDQLLEGEVSTPEFLLNSGSFGGSHDDSLWAALLYMTMGDWTGNSKFWDGALEIMSWVGSDTGHHEPFSGPNCDGGVYWQHGVTDGNGYKNAVTNGLWIHASARAYLHTKDSSHLDNAKAAWAFSKRMRDTDGLYVDGTRGENCDPSGTKWTYNSGVMVSGLGYLFKATGDRTYITEAETTIDGIVKSMSTDGTLAEGCDTDSCNFDQVGFKGLLMAHLGYFFDAVGDAGVLGKYSDWIGKQGVSIQNNAHDGDGKITSVWFEPNSSHSQKTDGPHTQSSALAGLLIAAKYGTC